MNKNIYLILSLLFLFTVDVIRVKYYSETEKSENEKDLQEEIQKKQDFSHLSDEDLKLEDDKNKTEIPIENEEKIKETLNGNEDLTMTISHCSTLISKAESIKKEIQERVSNIKINLSQYKPKGFNEYIIKFLTVFQYSLFILLFSFGSIKDKLTFIPSYIVDFIEKRKMIIGMVLYTLISHLNTTLSRTNAFEVYINQEFVYSGLNNKGLPEVEYLIEKIKELGFDN